MPCPHLIVVTNAAILAPNGLPGSIPWDCRNLLLPTFWTSTTISFYSGYYWLNWWDIYFAWCNRAEVSSAQLHQAQGEHVLDAFISLFSGHTQSSIPQPE